MKLITILFVLIAIGGCIDVPRDSRVCRVVREGDFKPIAGAHVHIQPYAPIHPFWPRPSDGITDANGNVALKLPADFWFYDSKATANGYVPGDGPVLKGDEGLFEIFYMRPCPPTESR